MRRRWTDADLAKLPANRVVDYTQRIKPAAVVPVERRRQRHNTPEKAELSLFLTAFCKNANIELLAEHKFCATRKFRFDWALPQYKIAIEYEGLHNAKSGHLTIQGYKDNCEKYNLAVKEGWRLLRYHADSYKKVIADLLTVIESTK